MIPREVNPSLTNPPGRLRVGCPVWACEYWRGKLFTRRVPRKEWLHQYSSVFGTVEGNSTFYALPSHDTIRRWAETTCDGFRFALKFPRSISHDKRLSQADQDTSAFLKTLEILRDSNRLGPSFLQLPPDFGPEQFPVLEAYLRNLPGEFPWAVEVRNFGWFDQGDHERRLDSLLAELQIDKVLFDSRPLYSKPPSDESERRSQTRKPKTPIRRIATGAHPFLRIVGRNTVLEAKPWIAEWAPLIAEWIQSGQSPFVFTHTPDDTYAPDFARMLMQEVHKHSESAGPPAEWPGMRESAERPAQRLLF